MPALSRCSALSSAPHPLLACGPFAGAPDIRSEEEQEQEAEAEDAAWQKACFGARPDAFLPAMHAALQGSAAAHACLHCRGLWLRGRRHFTAAAAAATVLPLLPGLHCLPTFVHFFPQEKAAIEARMAELQSEGAKLVNHIKKYTVRSMLFSLVN